MSISKKSQIPSANWRTKFQSLIIITALVFFVLGLFSAKPVLALSCSCICEQSFQAAGYSSINVGGGSSTCVMINSTSQCNYNSLVSLYGGIDDWIRITNSNCSASQVSCTLHQDDMCGEINDSVPFGEDEMSLSSDTGLKFKPQVTIPGSITIAGKEFRITSGEGIAVDAKFLGNYIRVFFKFFVGLLAVIAVVMVTWGGFKRIIAAGNAERISDSNDAIFSAIIGLVLALISYTLLNLINPALVEFPPLQGIDDIRRVEFNLEDEAETDTVTIADFSGVQPVLAQGRNIVNGKSYTVDKSLLSDLRIVAAKLAADDIQLIIASGYRSEVKQIELIKENCQNPPGSQRCNPKTGKHDTCILREGIKSCPHTTGRAVDLWAGFAGTQVISQDNCKKNKPACEEVRGMKLLIQAMRAQGFCKLNSEPWHFEKPKMSSTCF